MSVRTQYRGGAHKRYIFRHTTMPSIELICWSQNVWSLSFICLISSCDYSLFLFILNVGINECWIMSTVEQWRCRFLIDIEKCSSSCFHLNCFSLPSRDETGTETVTGQFSIYIWHKKTSCRQSCWQCTCCWQQKGGNKRILKLFFSWDDIAESSRLAKCNIAGPHPSFFQKYASPLL